MEVVQQWFAGLPVFWQLFLTFLVTMYLIMSFIALRDRRGGMNVVRDRLEALREHHGRDQEEDVPTELEEDEDLRRGWRGRRWDEDELVGTGFTPRLARKLRRADLRLRVSEFLTIQVLAGLAAGAVVRLLTGHLFGALVGILAGLWIPNFYLGFRYRRRLKQFNEQLPDALQLIANSLKSGYSFMQAADVVAREMPPPISTEFGQMVKENRVNIALEDALANLLDRVDSQDLDLMVTAVLIQSQVGGNLAQVLDTIGFTIRDRVRILGQIRTLTTQGRLSGWIVGLLPVGLMVMINVINPDYMAGMLTHPLGWAMLVLGLGLQLTGLVVIRKMVDVEV